MISFFAFLVGYVTGKFRSLTNIIIGIAFTQKKRPASAAGI